MAAAIMANAVIAFQIMLGDSAPVVRLAGSIVIGMIIYPVALLVLSPAVVTLAKALLLRYSIA
jgi:hypothetical protein